MEFGFPIALARSRASSLSVIHFYGGVWQTMEGWIPGALETPGRAEPAAGAPSVGPQRATAEVPGRKPAPRAGNSLPRLRAGCPSDGP